MSKVYVIPGNPVPLARARLGRANKVYDPQKNQKLMTCISIDSQHNGAELFTGPLHINITFFMPIPKSTSYKQALKLQGTSHQIKPDIDNLIKMVLDVCSNRLLYHDDCIISRITANKIYDITPRTEFTFIEGY